MAIYFSMSSMLIGSLRNTHASVILRVVAISPSTTLPDKERGDPSSQRWSLRCSARVSPVFGRSRYRHWSVHYPRISLFYLTMPGIDNPDALRKYYDLLLSLLRVIVTAVFSRGLHNEQMMQVTRGFLTENRQSMVGIFKRLAKIGGGVAAGHQETINDLAKGYMALLAATDFLEVSHTPPFLSTC